MNNINTNNDTQCLSLRTGMDDAFPINLQIRPVNDRLINLSHELVVELNPKGLTPLKERNAMTAMQMLIANLYTNYEYWKMNGTVGHFIPWLSYSRNRNSFSIPHRYVDRSLTYRMVIEKTINPLIENGYVDNVNGFFSKEAGKGKQSRLGLVGHRFASVFEDVYVDSRMSGKAAVQIIKDSEVLYLKDSNKQLIDYEDNAITSRMRHQLEGYDDFMSASLITLNGTPISSGRTRRVFNDAVFDRGGRFYGPSWQNLPKVSRTKLLIDGQATVERDYCAYHINMAYAIETGSTYLDGCPYDYSAFNLDHRLFRSFMKSSTLTVINCKNPTAGMAAINLAIRDLPEEMRRQVSGKKVLQMIQKKHEMISKYFCSGSGLLFQYADSQLTSSILEQCQSDNVVVLPVHDSYIVAKPYERYIESLMVDVFHDAYGCSIAVD